MKLTNITPHDLDISGVGMVEAGATFEIDDDLADSYVLQTDNFSKVEGKAPEKPPAKAPEKPATQAPKAPAVAQKPAEPPPSTSTPPKPATPSGDAPAPVKAATEEKS